MNGDGPERGLDDAQVSLWTRYSARKWAVHWLRAQRELIVSASRDESHARVWTDKEAKKATMQARRLMEAPALAERQIVLAEIIRREVLPAFDRWYDGTWEPEEPAA